MTDDQHGQGAPPGGGRWDPLPQGDYDDGATAFVKLPEGGIEALLAARGDGSPLAAPGHGYVPPQIEATHDGSDPAASANGAWAAPAAGTDWPAPASGTAGGDQFTYNPGATGQWTFDDSNAPAEPAPGHDVTGQWSIPVAGGDLPDESGEFTTSALVEQWGGGTPPATLPGGASAPWATEPAPDERSWGPETDGAGAPLAEAAGVRPDAPAFGHAPRPDTTGAAAHEHPAPHEQQPPGRPYEDGPGPLEAHRPPSQAAEDPRGPEAAHEPAETAEAAEDPRSAAGPDTVGEHPEQADADASSTRVDDDPQTDAEPEPEAAPHHDDHPLASYVLRVNGSDRPVTDAWIGESLLYVLRERLGLAGAKDGCSQGECGACNVQVDGRLVASCLVPAVTTAGSEIRTVEGLAVDGQPSDVQRALARCGAVQCGFCVPGMAMTVHDLLEGNPAPTELEARQALCGNLCRCSGYRGVLQAVQDVVAEREAHSAADAESDGDEARIPHQAGPGGGGIHASAFENPAQPHPHDPAYGQDGGHS
ncbi:2Fe-2S iron-sulfur cluster-binding protein [Streptomyces bobili]|uniref:2Fe-2S iron-sulfur cluster-binding protein n=1 Tax=Streptomyces bobili TaxID=67280 RepID=UPI00225925D5|nr:2Fe-2S iron-sulfur cluster-binding protein [Streptomyces bobili]MCX5524402.1 2Fe-2S iron-sulfur cluster-binding protein [Streptomyces bobili]